MYGNQHRRVAGSLYNLAELRYTAGDFDAAEEFVREAIEIRRGIGGLSDPGGPVLSILLAQILWKKGDVAGGDALFEGMASEARGLQGGRTALARGINSRAGILEDQGDAAGAEAMYRRSWQLYQEALGEEHRPLQSSRPT